MQERGLPDFPPDSTGMKPHGTSRLQADDEDLCASADDSTPAAFEPSACTCVAGYVGDGAQGANRFSSSVSTV